MKNVVTNSSQQKSDEKFMLAAFKLAQKAEQLNEIPVGAVVVFNNEIIGEGYNQCIALNDPSAHAEMIAIRRAGNYLSNYRLENCTLYVTLEPCPMCSGLLVHSRIKRLVFASKDDKTGCAGSVFNLTNNEKLNHQIEVHQGVLDSQCSTLLSSFFKKRRIEKKQTQKKAQFSIEDFTHQDIKTLRSWFKHKADIDKWAGPNFRFPHSIKSFGEDVNFKQLASYCLRNKNMDMVAFGQFYQRLNHCHLGRLVVNPRFRGQGIATRLISELSQIGLRSLGLTSLSLFVLADNQAALKLYKKLGFIEKTYPEQLPIDNCLYLVKKVNND